MAQGNIIQGQASGKLGSAVLMVRNGQQLSRIYTKAGARSGDQASESARIQRVKFGSASNQWGIYRFVCTRMYRKGRKATQSDYNYFVKRNNLYLPFLTKEENAEGVHVLQPGIFSEGTLGRIELIQTYRANPSSTESALQLIDSQLAASASCLWSYKLGLAKAGLKVLYPLARKITYLFSLTTNLNLAEEGSEFLSQQVVHFPITIDLYQEVETGENDLTVAQYMSNHISDSTLSELFAAQTKTIFYGRSLLSIWPVEGKDISILGRLGVLIFATDDNVADCYTTILPSSGVDPLKGVYSIWASYRTTEALRLAADSYGYQMGVMRDQVAAVGNDLTTAAVAYAARLREVDQQAAAEFEAFAKEVE